MKEKIKLLIAGAALGGIVGIAAGYGVARVVESRALSAPTDVKSAWDAYVVAQRNYMAAVKAEKMSGGSGQRTGDSGKRAVASGQGTVKSAQRTVTSGPKAGAWIAFDEGSAEFGTVDQGMESTKVFVYRNKGNQLLRISDVISSCGCTVVQPSPKELPPGGVGRLSVTFKSGNFSGPVHKTVTVRSNDPTAPSLVLGVNANVRTLFKLEPKVVALGEIERGKVGVQELVIKPVVPEAFAIQRITTTHPELRAEAISNHGIHGTHGKTGEEIRIAVALDANNKNYGPFTYATRVYLTRPQSGSAKPLELTIPVTGTIAGPLRVKPDAVFFGSVKEGERFKPQKVTLSSRSGKPVAVRTVDTGFAGLKASVKPVKPGLEYEVELTDEAPPPAGFFQRTMKITTSESNVPIEVRLSGVVMKAMVAITR